ncbi:amino acid transporter-1 [Coleophoma crateriformis]|uniref:Amino acid transporter-1 n=1 Tax=Coleophoma crateriformis TaxID=565419 RepID=A0A3D8Q975_9HELO|nr:amino acid transporter-1 [Coleophoma crateriformis]
MSNWDPKYFEKDEEKLKELGYKQQLLRNLSPLHSFGISFAVISVQGIIATLFGYGFATGGPGTMAFSWLIVSFFSFLVALSMAEIVSALPTSGGPYFWAATLAPPKYAPLASWITAWFNLLGLVASNTTAAYGIAQLVATAAAVKRPGFDPTNSEDIGICAALLVSWALMNTVGRPFLKHVLYFAIALNSVGILAFAVIVLVKAPTHQPASFVFTSFVDETGPSPNNGWATRASPAYVACIGSYMGLGAFFGYDASAHLAEETLRAAWIAPLGIITAVFLSGVFGFFLIVALLFSIQNLDVFDTSLYENPVLQILIESFGVNGGVALFTLPIMCIWCCGLFLTMSNSRLIWAFSRDHGVPYFFSKINERFMSPVRAVLLTSFLSFLLSFSALSAPIAFTAVTSIASTGVLISYGIPILLKVIYHKDFCLRKGPFQLGYVSRPISLVAVLWVIAACIILCLPTTTPITIQTLNYTPIAFGTLLALAMVVWLSGAMRFFVGPVKNWNATDISNLVSSTTTTTTTTTTTSKTE